MLDCRIIMFADRTNWDLTPNALSIALAAYRASGKPLLDLTASNPTECGFVYDSEAILAALANPAALHYEPDPRGLLSAREAVSRYYAGRGDPAGDHVPPDGVVLTTSTSEAYSHVFRLLCNAGDQVLVPQPSYPLFDFLADLQDVRLVRYPLIYDHGWQIDFHALQQTITPRTRAVIVVNPNNPTGNFCKPREMAQLNEVCAVRGMAIIADEVFLDYPLGKERPQSFAANQSALTFTISGISKICGLPQMKAAWLITSGPEARRAEALARLEVIADTYLSMNAPIQHALPIMLQTRHAFQAQLIERVRENLTELDRQLAAHKNLPSEESSERGISGRLQCEGGWCALLQLPANQSADELSIRLLKQQGVHLHPGHFYELAGRRFVVVGLITPTAVFSTGVKVVFG
jgi:alanine-synthesizing transaminase